MTLEFAGAAVKASSREVFVLQRNARLPEPGNIDQTLAEGEQLLECVEQELVAVQTGEIAASARTCPLGGRS